MYPLKFQTLFQPRFWGGQRLRTLLGKTLPPDLLKEPIGESWELADLPPNTVGPDSAGAQPDGSLSSLITNGPWAGQTLHQILAAHGPAVMGPGHPATFPLLIKYLDARDNLSIQVHPDAAYCAAHPGTHIKAEAWYVLDAPPGAKIYKGLQPNVTSDQLRAALQSHADLTPLLRAVKVRAGDCHYLPSGTLHALGAGVLVAEVQTPSDTTFRLFDWHRLGPDGQPRTLHIEPALETIHFGPAAQQDQSAGGPRSHIGGVFTTVSRLITCDHFTLERVRMVQGYQQDIPYSEPVVWMVLEGQGLITCDAPGPAATTAFTRGETLLLPANLKNAQIKTLTDCAWLEAKLPHDAVEAN